MLAHSNFKATNINHIDHKTLHQIMDACISITSLLSINIDRQLAENAAISYTMPIQILVIFSPISPNNHGNRGDGLVPLIVWEYSPKVGYSNPRGLVSFRCPNLAK